MCKARVRIPFFWEMEMKILLNNLSVVMLLYNCKPSYIFNKMNRLIFVMDMWILYRIGIASDVDVIYSIP